MGTRYVLFWFDVENCSIPESDDAAKEISMILSANRVRGTMKIVGQKARVLKERLRYDVIDALGEHAIGYHTDLHGLRPQPAEYMGGLGWLEGGAEFERRERRGFEEIASIWERNPVCYGQPGSNWATQVFPVLRKWNIRSYVSSFGYVGLRAQPFRYGGIINTSRMWGADGRGTGKEAHMIGLNFELGAKGALEEHLKLFEDSYGRLEDGGLISIMNHPCTLVQKEWFTTEMKPRALTAAGYRHFRSFLEHVLSKENSKTITADELECLYPDRAMGRVFGKDELLELARESFERVHFSEIGGMSLSASEKFGMFARFLLRWLKERTSPAGEACAYLDGPAGRVDETSAVFSAGADDFAGSVIECARFMRDNGRLPDSVMIGSRRASLEDYYGALARAVSEIAGGGRMPDKVKISPIENGVSGYASEKAAQSAWSSVMMRPGFSAPKLLEQARLQAWTIKPAILQAM